MTCSMTSFAQRELPTRCGVLGCEIKTVNHRYLDVAVRTAEPLRALEADGVQRIREKIARGRVECLLKLQADGAATQPRVDAAALAALAGEMRKAEEQLRGLGVEPAPTPVLDVMKWAGVAGAAGPDAAQLRRDAMQLLDQTLDDLIKSRREEGARLRRFILEHRGALEQTLARLRERYPQTLTAARAKLEARLAEIDVGIAPERMAQEAALLAQKFCIGADIAEELDRCASHVQELDAVFKRDEPIGRRLDFLMQELNREANTIASKSADVETTHAAVEAKTLIERMREQVQNIE